MEGHFILCLQALYHDKNWLFLPVIHLFCIHVQVELPGLEYVEKEEAVSIFMFRLSYQA